MLTYRPRGKNGILYIRGQVSLGDKRIDVKEFSSGTSDKDAASHLMAEYETNLRRQLMFGPAATVANGVMADAFASYLSKAKAPHPSDILRISILNQHIGDLSLNEPKQAWEVFRKAYLSKHEPAGQDRYRAVLQAAINVHRDVQYIWRDSTGADRFGAMPSWFGQRRYDLRSAGLLLPHSAPQWASSDYELWDRIDAATAATGDPTAVSAWHILAEMPKGLDPQWWDWLAVTFAERNLVRVGAPVAYAVHALAAPDGGWAIAPHVHLVVPARRYRSGARHGERMPAWAGCDAAHFRLERAWRTACGHARVKGKGGTPFMMSGGLVAETATFRELAAQLKAAAIARPEYLDRRP